MRILNSVLMTMALSFDVTYLQVDNSGYCIDAFNDSPFAMLCNTLEYSLSYDKSKPQFQIERGLDNCLEAVSPSTLRWSKCPSSESNNFLWRNLSSVVESKSFPGKCISYVGRKQWSLDDEKYWNKLILADCSVSAPIQSNMGNTLYSSDAPKLDPLPQEESFPVTQLRNASCYQIRGNLNGSDSYLSYTTGLEMVKDNFIDSSRLNATMELQRMFRVLQTNDGTKNHYQVQIDRRCLVVRDFNVALEPCMYKSVHQTFQIDCKSPFENKGYTTDYCSISQGEQCVVYSQSGNFGLYKPDELSCPTLYIFELIRASSWELSGEKITGDIIDVGIPVINGTRPTTSDVISKSTSNTSTRSTPITRTTSLSSTISKTTTTTRSSSIPTAPENVLNCGASFGNQKCNNGNCCSKYGYCGDTPEHCSAFAGCQYSFGICK